MTSVSNPVTGIILAGGNSSRLGYDKGFAKIAGKTLTEIAIANLRPLVSEILISTANPEYDQFGYPVVADIHPGIGPMGGIYSTLKQSQNTLNLVLSVDLPFANSKLLEYLLENTADTPVTVPWFGGDHYEPLCACYQRPVMDVMELFIRSGNYKLPDLFRKVSARQLEIAVDSPFYHPYLFQNINTKTDLEIAQKLTHLIK